MHDNITYRDRVSGRGISFRSPDGYTVVTAAAILGVSRQRVHKLVQEGRLERKPGMRGCIITDASLRRYEKEGPRKRGPQLGHGGRPPKPLPEPSSQCYVVVKGRY